MKKVCKVDPCGVAVVALAVVAIPFVTCLAVWLQQAPVSIPDEPAIYGAAERSGRWRRIRREHLEIEPTCAACGASEGLEVHHILAFSEYPELELARGNLITLCRAHHWLIGHDQDGPGPERPNWKTSNRDVVEHSHQWAQSGGWVEYEP